MVTERNPGYWRQLDTMPNSTWKDIGSRDFIKDYDELIWYPAEVDVSIRPSWGYVEGEEKQLYSLETLLYMYEKAVGGNATLLLNVPPNKEGLFDLEDVERLAELGKAIRVVCFPDHRQPGQKPFRRMEVMQRLYWMQTEHTLWNLQGNARR
ncbi:MAG: alpha-L-fucosidase [Lachnospiraceae bacterium]